MFCRLFMFFESMPHKCRPGAFVKPIREAFTYYAFNAAWRTYIKVIVYGISKVDLQVLFSKQILEITKNLLSFIRHILDLCHLNLVRLSNLEFVPV